MYKRERALIEAVAEDMASDLLLYHSLVQAVRIAVCKPHVSIDGHFDGMGIEILRQRQQK
jgi:dihydroneopterin aldolase